MEANEHVISELVGCKAPNFNVKDITGEHFLLQELKGKVVVINFWYTSCAPCIAEMPALNRLVREYSNKGVVFVAFARDDEKSLKEFLTSTKFNYKVISGAYDMTEKYCLIAGWPMNIVLDKNGFVAKIFSGGYTDERAETHSYDTMRPTIDKLLAAK